jgi:hypothetical protein
VIHMFKVFLPPVHAECAKVTMVCGHFQGKVNLFIIKNICLTACLVVNFNLPLWSN